MGCSAESGVSAVAGAAHQEVHHALPCGARVAVCGDDTAQRQRGDHAGGHQLVRWIEGAAGAVRYSHKEFENDIHTRV